MKAVVFDRIGSPLDVLYLAELPTPRPGPGEALVKMLAAPVSPGDFLFIENLYPEPKKPRLPRQIGGNHGLGVVEAGANGISAGTLVAFSHYDSWAEYAAIPTERLMPLPDGYPAEKGSQFFNLITAWDLLDAACVAPGGWLALTAGYSTVSVMALQFARQRGLKVLAIIRRRHDGLDLEALGATEVLDLSALTGDVGDRVRQITGGSGLNALIDSVGGPVTGDLIRSLGFGGRVVINGGMAAERFQLHNFDVLMKGLEIRAHVYRYFFDPPKPEDRALLAEIAAAAAPADFQIPIGGQHPLSDFTTVVGESLRNPGQGKRFFRM